MQFEFGKKITPCSIILLLSSLESDISALQICFRHNRQCESARTRLVQAQIFIVALGKSQPGLSNAPLLSFGFGGEVLTLHVHSRTATVVVLVCQLLC